MLKSRMALVFHYRKQNRYGLMALGGALESHPYFAPLEMHFIRREEELVRRLPAIARDHDLTVAAFSFFTSQKEEVADLVRRLRGDTGGKVLFIAGGPHPSGDPEGTLAMGFDAAALGDGEETIGEFLRALDAGDDPKGVRGLALRDAGGLCRLTGRRRPVDLDDYTPWVRRHRKYGPIEISRGCPHGCTFCQTTYLFGSRMRHRGLPKVLELVRALISRDIVDIRFISPSAFAWGSPGGREPDVGKLEALLEGISGIVAPRGRIYFGSFPSEVRPEHVTPLTLALVQRYAHNDNLVIGAQSGSPRMLRACRRGHGIAEVYRAAELILGTGLRANVDFIFGLPGETKEDERLTVKVVRELAAMGAMIHAHSFLPLPGTPLADAAPGRLGHELRETVRELAAEGKLFGEWHRQERTARRWAAERG